MIHHYFMVSNYSAHFPFMPCTDRTTFQFIIDDYYTAIATTLLKKEDAVNEMKKDTVNYMKEDTVSDMKEDIVDEDCGLFDTDCDDSSDHSMDLLLLSDMRYMYLDDNSEGNYRMDAEQWMNCYVPMMMQRSVRVFHLCHFMHKRITGGNENNTTGDVLDSAIICLKDMKASSIMIKPNIVIMSGNNKSCKKHLTKARVIQSLTNWLESCCIVNHVSYDNAGNTDLREAIKDILIRDSSQIV